jgi:hypothetical protein
VLPGAVRAHDNKVRVRAEAHAREMRRFRTQVRQARQARQRAARRQVEVYGVEDRRLREQARQTRQDAFVPFVTDFPSMTPAHSKAAATPALPARLLHVGGKAMRWISDQPLEVLRGVGEDVVGMGEGLISMERLSSPVYRVGEINQYVQIYTDPLLSKKSGCIVLP